MVKEEQFVHCGRSASQIAAAAFGGGSTAAAVDLGDGLLATLRTSSDGTSRVLSVENTADQARAFTPGAVFSQDEQLMFLRGETTTGVRAGELECELPPDGFVWLGSVRQETLRGDVHEHTRQGGSGG